MQSPAPALNYFAEGAKCGENGMVLKCFWLKIIDTTPREETGEEQN